MIYDSGDDWLASPSKRVCLFGMSGLGKTRLAAILRENGEWFHYSVDYRIGTRYMGEFIADNAKREAMKVPFLRELFLSDSIYISSNITFHNLAPLSAYLGRPGNPDKGGLPFAEYMKRQNQHRAAEMAATLDSAYFIARASDLYGYDKFACDTSGSVCEVIDPDNPDDPVLGAMAETMLMVWIEGSADHTADLIRRFDRAPKPMYYDPGFLEAAWTDYRAKTGQDEAAVDPDAFVRWAYARALAHRQPRYAAMARRGVTISAAESAAVTDAADFEALIARAIDRVAPNAP